MMSSPVRASSSWLLLSFSADFSPSGSSPLFFSGLRRSSRILRNAPLLARATRKPSSSFNSTLNLSTSTEGRRVAPCRPMPTLVSVSSAMRPLPFLQWEDNGYGTRWFHGAGGAEDAGWRRLGGAGRLGVFGGFSGRLP